MKVYEDFWKPIICNEDGTINEEQLAKELFDFHESISNVAVAYNHVAGVSKITTDPGFIMDAYDKAIAKAFSDGWDQRGGEVERLH